MKYKFLFLVCMISFCFFSGKGQSTFQKTFGIPGTDFPILMQMTSDSGFILVGQRFVSFDDDILLVKLDKYGTQNWSKKISSVLNVNSVFQTSDGGFIIGGAKGNNTTILLKTDAIGNILWTKNLNTISTSYSVFQTTDLNYISVGFTSFFGAGDWDIYLFKMNSLGDTIWTRTYGGIAVDWGFSAQQTNDGGIIILGNTESFGAGGKDIYLLRTDANGDTLWTKTYGGPNDEFGNFILQTNEGGFIITGYTLSFGSGNKDVYLIKTDGFGNVIWSKTYGGTDEDWGYCIRQTKDVGYIISGSTKSFGSGNWDSYLIKTDSTGSIIWSKTQGGSNYDGGGHILLTADGGYFIFGQSQSFGTHGGFYLIKTDSSGNSGCNELDAATIINNAVTVVSSPLTYISSGGSIGSVSLTFSNGVSETTLCYFGNDNKREKGINNMKVYPNPGNGKFTIELNEEMFYQEGDGKTLMEIFNMLGSKIFSISKFTNAKSEINLSGQSAGIYLVLVSNGILSETKKIIIQK